jgi:hypothetical protein
MSGYIRIGQVKLAEAVNDRIVEVNTRKNRLSQDRPGYPV